MDRRRASPTGSTCPTTPRSTAGATPASRSAQFRADADLLAEYYDATHRRSLDYLAGLGPDDLDRIVDDRWDPPVTLGVRLVSVVNDDTQHVGQAAYVKGLLGGLVTR